MVDWDWRRGYRTWRREVEDESNRQPFFIPIMTIATLKAELAELEVQGMSWVERQRHWLMEQEAKL